MGTSVKARTQSPVGGELTVDPTENVKALMEASIVSLTNEMDLRARLADEQIKRMEREAVNQEKIANLRAEHYQEIRRMESDRVDKIRSVDVANAAATAAQLLSAVQTLATSAQVTAETLRNQTQSDRSATAAALERTINPIIERLSILEKLSATVQGKAAYADPAVAEAVAEMKRMAVTISERQGRETVTDPQLTTALMNIQALLAAQAAGTAGGLGKQAGADQTRSMLTWGLGLLATMALLYTFFQNQTRGSAAPAAVAPQVIYVPAPAAGSGAPLPGTTTPSR